MEKDQINLVQEGYVEKEKTEDYIVATKDGNTFFIKIISLLENVPEALTSEITALQELQHPHVVKIKNSFKDKKTYYIVMENCHGGNLADKIREMPEEPIKESEILSWIAEICLALKAIHEVPLLHQYLMPKKVFFTEFGLVCLGGFGNINENSEKLSTASESTINYMAPEVLSGNAHNSKSDIWSVGCILYELCTKRQAFSAETTIRLVSKINSGKYPSLPKGYSDEVGELLDVLLTKNPSDRPTASEILARPIMIRCLSTKCQTTVEELYIKLKELRALADGLERIHEGTTIGSLAGGVIGAVGGITSIVGVILAPFTLGTSLIVTGVGVGVGAAGGFAAGVSNIIKMVNQASDRKTVRGIIKEIEQKMNAVVFWLLEINSSLQTISSRYAELCDAEGNMTEENLRKIGVRAGRGLTGISELIRLVGVMNIGKIAAQTSRVVRVAEAATGVLSGLFVAVDIFFIAMDAKEIHQIRRAREAERQGAASSGSENKKKTKIRSELMKFVNSIREAAENLETTLDDLRTVVSSIAFEEQNS